MKTSMIPSYFLPLIINSLFLYNKVKCMDCTLQCERGICEIGQADFSVFNKYNTANNLPFANITHVDMMYCKCPEGYTGVTCEIAYESCNSNQHACFHGAKCVQTTSALGTIQYRCDCTQVDDDNTYAGLYCEHAATSTCEFGTTFSKNSFCTNGGECVTTIAIGQSHEGCKCPEGFTGQHCEYSIAHTQSLDISISSTSSTMSAAKTTTATNGTNQLGAIIVFICVMILCTIILLYIFSTIRKIRRGDDIFSQRDRDVQHANQMNIEDDMQLEEVQRNDGIDVVDNSKENEML